MGAVNWLLGKRFNNKLMTQADVNAQNTSLVNKIAQAFYGFGMKFTKYDDNNNTYIEKGYNMNADVYAVVSQKATEVQRVPYTVKNVKDEHQKDRYQQFRAMIKDVLRPDTMVKKIAIETKAFSEKDMPLPLERPNASQTWREFFALCETYLDLIGNLYMYLKAPEMGLNQGEPTEIYLLPSQWIQIVLRDKANIMEDSIDNDTPIKEYILTQGNRFIKFTPDEIVHVKYPNPNFDLSGGHLYGQSPLRAALTNIQSSNSAAYLNTRTLANGGSFGFLSTKEPLTEPQAKALKERLEEMHKSEADLSNFAGSSKEVVFTRVSLTTEELKPFDYLEHDQKAICNVLHWDDKLLNSDDGAKYDNYKIALRRAITSGISPNLRLLESAFNNDILTRYKKYQNTVLVFDESQLPEMQEDMEKLTKWLNDALDRGVISRDEYRMAINYSEMGTPEMQTHTVGMNIIPLEDAIMPDEALTFNE